MGTPVTLVLVSVAGHSRTMAGAKITGGAVSRTVIRWTQVVRLLQSSVAAQVRSITFIVTPGGSGGCGGSGPSGGCTWGGGSGSTLFALIEIVLLPIEMGSGAGRNF